MTIHPDEPDPRSGTPTETGDSRTAKKTASSHTTLLLDETGTIRSWPDSAVSLYGFDPDMILEEHLRVLFADVEWSSRTLEGILDRAKSEPQEIEHRHNRANGAVFRAMTSLTPLRTNGFHGYAVVIHDMTSNNQYEQLLEQQNDRLKQFTEILAHDLRNPLNVIEGRLELYRKTNDVEHIDHIEATTDRMEQLIDDLLRIARQGTVVLDPEPTDLESVIETAWEGTGQRAAGTSLQYDPVPTVGADTDRLCELFENLFMNALEHAGPDVTVTVGPLEDGFYVDDDGPGIAAEWRDDVFGHGFTTTESGNGYGLSIVFTIVEAHGWEIQATEAPSGGARFEITGVEFVG